MFVGQLIRLHTDDEWDGLYGMVFKIGGDEIIIFCMAKPYYNYIVKRENIRDVLEILDY